MAEVAESPRERAEALVREAARWFLQHSAELADQLDEAVMAAAPPPLRADVTLAAEAAASNRANVIHWAICMTRDPTARVPANLSPEVLEIARVAVRRGADQMIVNTYHSSQNVAWRYCMQLLFAMS